MSYTFTIVNQDFLVDRGADYAVDTSLGAITATLPAVRTIGIGQSIYFVNLGKNKLTVTTSDSTIDGATSLVVDASLGLISLGNRWATYNLAPKPQELPTPPKPLRVKTQEVAQDVNSQPT